MSAITRRKFARIAAGAAMASVSSRSFGLARSMGQAGAGFDANRIANLSLTEAAGQLRSGALTSTELVKACLERISVYQPKIDAFITVLRTQALAQAAQMDAEQKAGKLRGPLHGIPIALKDNIDTAGIRTTAGSQVFDDRFPKENAVVTQRLIDSGAILLGKANLDEFADCISYFGSPRNPWGLDRDPMGSSSGSAGAVSASLVYGALGTDTGGSVRLPAAYCGIVGLKPTNGLVPIRGIIPLALTLDSCGPITRTVEDAALMLNQLAGYDNLDITSVQHEKEDYVAAMNQPVSGFRLGIPRAPFYDHVDDDTSRAVEAAIDVLTKMTKSVREVDLPPTTDFTWNNVNSLAAETYAYHQELFRTRNSRYGLALRLQLQQLKDGLDGSDEMCSAKIAGYINHHWELELLRRMIDQAFTNFDLVVVPTIRTVPEKLSAVIERAEHVTARNPDNLDLDNCTPFNLYGIPAISIPCGFAKDGMPVGLMIAGPHFSEGKILALARAYEQETRWDTKRPPLTPNTVVPPIRPVGGIGISK